MKASNTEIQIDEAAQSRYMAKWRVHMLDVGFLYEGDETTAREYYKDAYSGMLTVSLIKGITVVESRN